MSKSIKKEFKENFPLDKLQQGLKLYLKEIWSDKLTSEGYEIIASHEGCYEANRLYTISSTEQLTILSYSCTYRERGGFHYRIKVGLGEFLPADEEYLFFFVEKGFGIFHYNDDLSLYDIEFLFDSVHCKERKT